MKRAGNLFERILDRENLRRAVHKALQGKRDRPEARDFTRRLDHHLNDMAARLRQDTFSVGKYYQFVIHDPKERIITAPCFAERVLHHAILNVCEPHFERWLIGDTFACRRGKGRGAALARAGQFARRFPFFLKMDIRKYFDSISHEELLKRLGTRFKDRRLLALLERIVRTFRGALGRGLPIGSLTSQHFANFYLGWFDRFIKEKLRVRGYVRYMDDLALWGDSRDDLKQALAGAETFLRQQLHLELKAVPYLNRTEHGMDFLGCRVHRQRLTLNARSRRRFRRKLAALEERYLVGAIDEGELQQRATALTAFSRTAGVSSRGFRQAVLERLGVSGQRARTG
jgi:hypothetical protein